MKNLTFDANAPTLYLDFDGTLHTGHALFGERGEVVLDTGRPVMEFAPLLAKLLMPYPDVQIVLATSWLRAMTHEEVISYLSPELRPRVVGSTVGVVPTLSEVLNGSDRSRVILKHAWGHGLKT